MSSSRARGQNDCFRFEAARAPDLADLGPANAKCGLLFASRVRGLGLSLTGLGHSRQGIHLVFLNLCN